MHVENNIICGPPADERVSKISFGQYVFDKLRTNSDRIAQVDLETGETYTAKDILEQGIRVSKILQVYGVKAGDRVSIASENHPNFLAVSSGILYIGAVVAPLNYVYTEGEYRHFLEIYQPRVIFVSRKCERIIAKIAPTLSWKMNLIQLDDRALTSDVPTLKELSKRHANVVDPNNFVLTPIADTSKEVAVILASSGTTGLPKGVVLSHQNWIALFLHSSQPGTLEFVPSDRILLFLPTFHGYAFSLLNKTICEGATVYLMRTYSVDTLVKTIEKHKITFLPVPPTVLVALSKYPDLEKYDFSSLRQLICGAAKYPSDVARTISERMKVVVRNGYGLTEITVVSFLSDKRGTENDGMGILIAGHLSKIVDPTTGEALGPGQVGEICFKGHQIMLGYFQNPKATAETIDADNWLHTGDLGYYDTDGVLFVTGRMKELIKYKGYQVSASEVETVIHAHPGVKDAAVVGKPDEISGELPMAFVVKQPGSTVTAEEIIEFTKGKLSRHKWLRGGVIFVQSLPKTSTGKLKRRELLNLISKI